MATLDKQAVRAEIIMGSYTVRTPDIISFSVSRTRGQMYSTFNASVKVPYTMVEAGDFVADSLQIRAGAESRLNTIFTGKIYKCVVSPIRTDASKVQLSISGKDVLGVLEGQKVNRRLKTYKYGDKPIERWGIVNNVVKHNTPAIQKFKNKIFSPYPLGVVGLEGTYAVETPPSFKYSSAYKPYAKRTLTASLSAETIPSSEQ
jgi:hypothetical protein